MSALGNIQLGVFFALGLVVSFVLLVVVRRFGPAWSAARDHGFHHTHTGVIPRFGGLALVGSFIAVGVAASLFLQVPKSLRNDNIAMFVTSLAMFGLGFVDDLRPIGAKKKLLGQIIISLAASFWVGNIQVIQNPFGGQVVNLGIVGVVISTFWLVAFTNLINLADGIDGLAGGISLMLMGLLAFVGLASGAILPVCWAVGIAGALVAFLRFNFPPAKIYLGDGGAYFLGFLIGLFSIRLSQKGTVLAVLAVPLLALALPILDTSLAIVRRGVRGLPLFRADRRHLHHRLIAEGFSHRDTVLLLYGFSSFCCLAAIVIFTSGGRAWPVAVGGVFLIVILAARRLQFARAWFNLFKVLGESQVVREEVRYALALCKWFEMEGGRTLSKATLWSDFCFLSSKLGFSSVRLRTKDGNRNWQSSEGFDPRGLQHCEIKLNHPTYRSIVFSATLDRLNHKTFDQLAELAGEGWMKAATAFDKRAFAEVQDAEPELVTTDASN